MKYPKIKNLKTLLRSGNKYRGSRNYPTSSSFFLDFHLTKKSKKGGTDDMKKYIIIAAIIFLLILCAVVARNPSLIQNKSSHRNYKNEMVNLISDIHTHAKAKNKNFNVIINGGYGLYNPGINKSKDSRLKLMKSVEATLIEDIYYGWDCTLNKATPKKERDIMLKSVAFAHSNNIPVFNIEYCTGNKATAAKKYSKNKTKCYTAPSVDLNKIPSNNGSDKDITNIKDVTNYLVLLDPGKYKTKDAYLKALRNTNYDMIIIDAFYDDKILTKNEVASLKKKHNGKKRLCCTYVSVGEAESYRYYFKSSWKKNKPSWIKGENKSWAGNYKVKYWSSEWKNILFKSKDSYLDRVLNVGFDGAYFDVIDAYEYFE